MSDWNYCPGCGTALQNPETAPEAAAEVETADIVSGDVEIARIQAERDVTLARIAAKVEEHVSDVDQAAELAAAEATADALQDVLSPEPAPDAPTIVVEAPDETPADDEIDGELPPAEADSEPSESKPKPYQNPWFA
jgi:peptidyl-tRNA hydrolase